jgi:hypothetical protein
VTICNFPPLLRQLPCRIFLPDRNLRRHFSQRAIVQRFPRAILSRSIRGNG